MLRQYWSKLSNRASTSSDGFPLKGGILKGTSFNAVAKSMFDLSCCEDGLVSELLGCFGKLPRVCVVLSVWGGEFVRFLFCVKVVFSCWGGKDDSESESESVSELLCEWKLTCGDLFWMIGDWLRFKESWCVCGEWVLLDGAFGVLVRRGRCKDRSGELDLDRVCRKECVLELMVCWLNDVGNGL